ncbi:MAG: amidase [Pseudacidovorax sp.]|nr:amidase [Pseudacidovorax sp.]
MNPASGAPSALCHLSAVELQGLIASRALSPVDLMHATLARAEAMQRSTNCFITLCADEALAQAAQAERRLVRGESMEPLHGLPFTVKDIVDTRGVRTTYGSLVHQDHVPDTDAVAVARLKAAGAILVGKTTTSEFGTKCLTDAPLFGRTANAWHAQRTSGGSSGGAAVAVATGVTALAVATDGGGSTRIPAACNGVVGFKQSLGVVPHSQVADAFGNYTYVTPMTRTVADTALMLQAMAGPHACDPWSLGAPVALQVPPPAAQSQPLRGLRIAFCAVPPGRPIARDVQVAFERALGSLEAMGAHLSPIDGHGFDVEPIWRVINHTSWAGRFKALAAEHGERLSPSLLQQLALVRDVDGVAFQRAMYQRTELFRRVQALFEDHALLVTPTLSRTALPIDQDLFAPIEIDGRRHDEVRPNWFPWTMPFNLTGHPAVSLPCDAGADGLPIGLQMVGRFKEDGALLYAARAFEQGHRPARPLSTIAQP